MLHMLPISNARPTIRCIAGLAGVALIASPWLGLFLTWPPRLAATMLAFALPPVGVALGVRSYSKSQRRIALVTSAICLALSVLFWISLLEGPDPSFANDEFAALLGIATVFTSLTIAPGLAAAFREHGAPHR